MEDTNVELKTEIGDLKQKLKDTERVVTEFVTIREKANKLTDIKLKLEAANKEIGDKNDQLEDLKGKNLHLQGLLNNLNRWVKLYR